MDRSYADDPNIKAEAEILTEIAYVGLSENLQKVDAKLTEDSLTYSAAKYGGLLAAIYERNHIDRSINDNLPLISFYNSTDLLFDKIFLSYPKQGGTKY